MDIISITDLKNETDFVCLLGFTFVHSFERPPLHGLSSLLLKPLSDGKYKRVGCMPYLENDKAWFEDAEQKTITFV